MKVKFPAGNNLFYCHDFGFWRNVPSNIEFDLEENEEFYILKGCGYGEAESYGNGALYLPKKQKLPFDISEFIVNEQLKRCSICGSSAEKMWDLQEKLVRCTNRTCHNSLYSVYLNEWQERPIEDELQARITELEAELAKLKAPRKWIDVRDRLPIGKSCGKFVYVRLSHMGEEWVSVDRIRQIGDSDRYEWEGHPLNGSWKCPTIVAWSPLPLPPEITQSNDTEVPACEVRVAEPPVNWCSKYATELIDNLSSASWYYGLRRRVDDYIAEVDAKAALAQYIGSLEKMEDKN